MKRPKGPSRRIDRWIAARWRGAWVLWRYHKWKGLSLPSWVAPGRRQWCSLDGFTHGEKLDVKRPDVKTSDEHGGGVDLPGSKVLMKFERLADLLQSSTYDDGTAKGQRCLMLFIDGATVRVLAKVQRPPLKLSSIGRSVDEALAALDALLGAPDVPWECDATANGKPHSKRR